MGAAGGLFSFVILLLPSKPMFIHFRLPAQRITLEQQLNITSKNE